VLAAGWYPDPMGRFEGRYHDGDDWTANVSDGGTTEADPLPPEGQRPMWARSQCPLCTSPNLLLVPEGHPKWALLCRACGVSLSFYEPREMGTFFAIFEKHAERDRSRLAASAAERVAQLRAGG
jgi:hypothetical protein